MIGVGAGPTGRTAKGAPGGRASERDCWIALSSVPGIGPAGFARLLARHGSAAAAWRAGPDGARDLARHGGEAVMGLEAVRDLDPRAVARSLERATERAGGRVVTGLDEAYPPALLTLDPRPPTLFVIGPRHGLPSACRRDCRDPPRFRLRHVGRDRDRRRPVAEPASWSFPAWRWASTAPHTARRSRQEPPESPCCLRPSTASIRLAIGLWRATCYVREACW